MLCQIQAPQDLTLWCTTGGDWERPALSPYRLAAPALAGVFGPFKQEGARENYTHTPTPGPGPG